MTLVKFKTHPTDRSFNNLMDNFFTPFTSLYRDDVSTLNTRNTTPANIKEVGNSYQVEIVAPGFDKENFKIDLDQKTLTISTEVKSETEEIVAVAKTGMICFDYSIKKVTSVPKEAITRLSETSS